MWWWCTLQRAGRAGARARVGAAGRGRGGGGMGVRGKVARGCVCGVGPIHPSLIHPRECGYECECVCVCVRV